jgi:hypothetical protein
MRADALSNRFDLLAIMMLSLVPLSSNGTSAVPMSTKCIE